MQVDVAGTRVELTNLSKVFYPQVGFTKAQVIDYYARVAPALLPHLENRPISLKRYPDGVTGEYFFQKQAPQHRPDWIKTIPVKTGRRQIDYCLINELPDLIWASNLANLELHTFLHRAPEISRPTMLAFDLDPGEGVDILLCSQVALWIRKTEEDLFGKDGLLKDLSKQLVERILQTEITHHLGYEKHSKEGHHTGNSRNGKTKKTIRTGSGDIEIEVPRDRKSEFQPILIEKRQTRLKELDAQVLSLYSRGMTIRDIQEHVSELYGTEISPDLISTITDAVLSEVTEWRNRPLDKIYPIVFIDGFVVKARLDSVVCNRTVYVIYGITLEGKKEVLGLYLGETEGAKFWLYVLTELKNRGLEDIFILCADGLKGLPEAVEATFPKAIFQTCIVHMTRHSLNYVPHADKKAVAADLKKIYQSNTAELALEALDDFELAWGDQYPAIVKSWRTHWEKVIPFLQFPKEIRRVIYTTNIVESLNNTLRKSVRNRGHFSTEDSIMKVLYLAIRGISKKWSMPIHSWKQALNHFAIMFEDRFPERLAA